MQRELADDENVAIDVIHGEIHLGGVTGEDAKADDLLREPDAVGGTVVPSNAEENEKPRANFAGRAVGGLHAGGGNSLNHGTHE
jgi:hypothetical protein